jgi:phospholipase C
MKLDYPSHQADMAEEDRLLPDQIKPGLTQMALDKAFTITWYVNETTGEIVDGKMTNNVTHAWVPCRLEYEHGRFKKIWFGQRWILDNSN